jgi:EAL domain-containing protein (putative c-di-GMP-specific phosphodiesterase class I)
MGKSLQPQMNAIAVRQSANTPPPAGPAVPTPAPTEPVTAESLGWQLRAALPPLRLHSVSLYDEQANVLWLSEGALGPDEHNVVVEAIDALGNDPGLTCYETGLEDGRVAIFLPVRSPQGGLVGLAMILADIKSVGDGVIERLVTPQIRTVMQKLAVLLRPAQPRAASGESSPPSLELAPELPAAPVANPAPPVLSPQAVDDILEFELTPDPPAPTPSPSQTQRLAALSAFNSANLSLEATSERPTVKPVAPVLAAAPPLGAAGKSAATPKATQGSSGLATPAPSRAASINGAQVNGTPINGASTHGASTHGASTHGPSTHGPSVHGAAVNGAAVNGAAVNGAATHGALATAAPTIKAAPVGTAAPVIAAAPARGASQPSAPPPVAIDNSLDLRLPQLDPPSTPTVFAGGNVAHFPSPAAAHGVPTPPGAMSAHAAPLAPALSAPTVSSVPAASSAPAAMTGTSKTLGGASEASKSLSATSTSRVLVMPEGMSLVLEVQPFSKLRSGGRTRRYEVLARSSHPNRVPPGIDKIALQQLLTWMGVNRSAWNLEPTSFTLNLSIATLEDERFPQFVASNLKTHGIAPDNIGFEIAEPLCLQRRAQVERFITLCDKLGCFVVIDDFSLDSTIVSLLRSKALRLVRIDPKLTSVALKDKLAQAMVVAIAQAVKVLGIHCAAKRVESQAALQWLTAIGCDFAQGAALAQVVPLESLGQPPAPTAGPPAA